MEEEEDEEEEGEPSSLRLAGMLPKERAGSCVREPVGDGGKYVGQPWGRDWKLPLELSL